MGQDVWVSARFELPLPAPFLDIQNKALAQNGPNIVLVQESKVLKLQSKIVTTITIIPCTVRTVGEE